MPPIPIPGPHPSLAGGHPPAWLVVLALAVIAAQVAMLAWLYWATRRR